MYISPFVISGAVSVVFAMVLFYGMVVLPLKTSKHSDAHQWRRRNIYLCSLVLVTAGLALSAALINSLYACDFKIAKGAYYVFTVIQLLVLFIIVEGYPSGTIHSVLQAVIHNNSQMAIKSFYSWSWNGKKSLYLTIFAGLMLLPATLFITFLLRVWSKN